MDKKQFDKIKIACERKGISILQDDEAQRNLDYFGVEAATLDKDTILLRKNPTASAVFEELIHITQYRKNKFDGTLKSELLCEIEAKEKLIYAKKQYKITDKEDTISRLQLNEYKRALKDLEGKDND